MNENDIARQCMESMWAGDFASQDMGIEVDVTEPGSATAEFAVQQRMVNGHDICHGGYIFALADTAFAFACNTYNRVTVAASASIEFLRPARLGDRLTATASEAHRGGRTGVYDIEVVNQDGDTVAIFRGRSYATSQPMIKSDTEKIE
jgi:acyl-CoA thioesterase